MHAVIGSSNGFAGLIYGGDKVIEEAIVGKLVAWIDFSWHEVEDEFVAIGLDGSLRVVVMSRMDVKLRE